MTAAEQTEASANVEAPPSTSPARVILLPRRAKPFYGRHPWVYAGAIDRVEGNPPDGDVVDLYSHEDHFIARGLYNSHSNIRIRLYSWNEDVALDADFFRVRIERAIRLRDALLGWNKAGGASRSL